MDSLWLLLLLAGASACLAQDLDQVISQLAHKVAASQIVNPSSKHESFQKQVGVYPCNIRLNFNGDPAAKVLRDAGAVFDNNAFVTLWVTVILLESSLVESGPQPSQQQLELALKAIASYHDKNRPSPTGLLTFWPQSKNQTSGRFFCNPQNLLPIVNDADKTFDTLHKLLDDLGLEKYWDKHFKDLVDELDSAVKAFHIPADFDDTFVNLGLGSLLAQGFPSAHQQWLASNSNIQEAMNALKKYAYRPHSSDPAQNFIDTRTYFYMREFLWEFSSSPLALVTTWAQDITEDKETFRDFAMPFHANNVDLTVSANVVYGLSASVLDSSVNGSCPEWFDSELQMIHLNTSNMLSWFIMRNLSSRPDLALTYYPSVFNFYWFSSRIWNLLASYVVQHKKLPCPSMDEGFQTLELALLGSATRDLLSKASTDKDGLVYFDDFLGDADKNIFGKPVNHAEDRIASTAMAVNVLMYIWTLDSKFIADTPQEVVDTIVNASQWLVKHCLSGEYKDFNVVFSGSVKTVQDLPFFYPNLGLKFLNGSSLPANSSDVGDDGNQLMVGIHGLVSKEQYEQMVRERHFGMLTPVDFHGYNVESAWPFWSSEPFTQASALLALTHYRALHIKGSLNHS